MAHKTNIEAEDPRQDLHITRTFDLPVDLLFKAYTEAELLEQWMGNKILNLDCRPHGSYQFETKNAQGNVVFRANGVFHQVVHNRSIIRTFEMENSGFPVQLEYLSFEAITDETSKLSMHIVYKSVADRNNMLKLPFAQGINMAHNRLQEIISNKTK